VEADGGSRLYPRFLPYGRPGKALTKNTPAVLDAGRDLAMQIAAMNPSKAVDPDSVPAEVVAREKSIVTEQIRNDPKLSGKPDEMIDKNRRW